MKLLRLTLCNLASIAQKTDIFFDQEPLKSAGLIAITGRTGAGKSTLLDALCLALFNEIPRLKHSQTSKLIKLADEYTDDAISGKDTRQILRRGAAFAFAEVEFIGLDHQQYISRWEVKRYRNQAKGKLKSVERSIIRVADQALLADKVTACHQLIVQLIGLDFTQFTRAVLLAQSEVGAFLKAKDQERADLLEYLTDSKLFSEISRLSYEKTAHYKAIYEQQQLVGNGITILDDEQRQILEQQQQQLKQQLKHTKSQLHEQQHCYERYQRYQQIQHELDQQYALYQQHDQKGDMIQQQNNRLKRLQTFLSIQPHLQQLQNSILKLNEKQDTLNQIKHHLVEIEQQYQQVKQQLQQQKDSYYTAQQHYQDLVPYVEEALELYKKITFLHEVYQKQSNKIQQIKSEQRPLIVQKQQLQQQLYNSNQTLQEIQQALDQSLNLAEFDSEPKAISEKLNHIQQLYQQIMLGLPKTGQYRFEQLPEYWQTLQQEYQYYVNQYGDIATLQQKQLQYEKQEMVLQTQLALCELALNSATQYQTKQKQQQQCKIQHQRLTASIEKQRQQEQLAQQQYQHTEQQVEQLTQFIQEQQLLSSKHVKQLRQLLKTNQPCMVCGSTHHPYHNASFQQDLLSLQHAQLTTAKERRDTCLQTWQKEQHRSIELQQQMQLLQTQQQELTTELSQLQHRLQQDLKSLTCFQTSINIQDIELICFKLTQYQQQCQQEKQQLQQQQQQKEHLEHFQHLETCYQQQKLVQDHYQELLRYIQNITKSFDLVQQGIWQRDPIAQSEQLSTQLNIRQSQLKAFQQQQMILEDVQQQLDKVEQQFQLKQHLLQQLEQEQDHTVQQGKHYRQSMLAIMQQHHAIDKTGKPIQQADSWKKYLEQSVQEHQQTYQVTEHQYHQLEQDYHAQQRQVDQQHTEYTLLDQQRQQHQQHIDTWLKTHLDFTQSDLDLYLHQDVLAEIQHLQQQCDQYQQQKGQLEGKIATLEQQLKRETIDPSDDITSLKQALVQLQTTLEQYEQEYQQCAVQLTQDQQQRERFAHHQQLIQRCYDDYYRWYKISSLIGHHKGETFQKVAQEYHLDILVEYANLQLNQLAPRYELQRIPHSLSLAIKDHDMNDEVRAVLSLSGGESFLVALALALAIAQMASGSMKLDTLFIDEGFGTLDQDSLQLVMNTLDRLQSQGRRVIIISHIQEIHEQIPVKIRVERIGEGKSQVLVQ